jgi:competence protein ComEA
VTEAPPTPPPDGLDSFNRPAPPPSLRERFARVGDAVGLRITPLRIVAFVCAATALAVAAFVVLRPAPTVLPEASLPFADPGATESPTTTSAGVSVLAHAAGAVVAPGVYQLPAGSRIADLVEAAGGASADADLNRVNLAAPVEDGQQVYVPRVGETPTGTGGAGPATADDGAAMGPIDVNTASAETLDELPGVGPAIARAIVTYRDEHGPFGSVDELVEVPGIGEAKLAVLRDLVTV